MRFTDATGRDRADRGRARERSKWSTSVPEAYSRTSARPPRRRPTGSTSRVRPNANLSPVWGLSLASGLTDLLAEPGEPIGSVTVDGVEHSVERVTDPDRLAAITANVGLRRRADRRRPPSLFDLTDLPRRRPCQQTGSNDTPAELTLTFVSELVAEQLSVAAIHRRLSRHRVRRPRRGARCQLHLSDAGPSRRPHPGGDGRSRRPVPGRPRRGRDVAAATPRRLRRCARPRRRLAGTHVDRHRRRGVVPTRRRRACSSCSPTTRRRWPPC